MGWWWGYIIVGCIGVALLTSIIDWRIAKNAETKSDDDNWPWSDMA